MDNQKEIINATVYCIIVCSGFLKNYITENED